MAALSSSVSRAKYSRNHTQHQITAKAPAPESFNISSFRSREAWEASASTVSQYPSRWMPPVTAAGTAASRAARRTVPNSSKRHSASVPQNAAPTAAPTNGKKARVCRIFLSFHSTCGIGIRE